MLDELLSSVCEKVRLSAWLAFRDVKRVCAAGGIGVPIDGDGVLLLTCHGVQETVDLLSSEAARASALS